MAKDLVTQIRENLTLRRVLRHFPDAEDAKDPKGEVEYFERMRDQGLRKVAGHGHWEVIDKDLTPTTEVGRPLTFEILHSALSRVPMKIKTLAQGDTSAVVGLGSSTTRIEYPEVQNDTETMQKCVWWRPERDRITLHALGQRVTDVRYWAVPIEADVLLDPEWERGAVAAAMSIVWTEIAARVTRDGEFSMPGIPLIKGNTTKAMAVAEMYHREMNRAVI